MRLRLGFIQYRPVKGCAGAVLCGNLASGEYDRAASRRACLADREALAGGVADQTGHQMIGMGVAPQQKLITVPPARASGALRNRPKFSRSVIVVTARAIGIDAVHRSLRDPDPWRGERAEPPC